MEIRIVDLVSDENCYKKLRELRWKDGVFCPHCKGRDIRKNGHHNLTKHRQRYICKTCHKQFDDLTNSVFEGHHQPLTVWISCLYLMALNVSNLQIAKELGIDGSDCQKMTDNLRQGTYERLPVETLGGEVEIDELYLVAGHKGQPSEVQKKGRKGRKRRPRGKRGRGTAKEDKPPVLGMVQRGGPVAIKMLDDVKMATIEPIIKATVKEGSKVFTDEYNIYNNMCKTYTHNTVNHGKGEYARDGDGDGKCEVHVNTIEGFWSLLRSWLRPHRGLSQKKLPIYLGFFQFIHNIRKRGQEALGALIGLLVAI